MKIIVSALLFALFAHTSESWSSNDALKENAKDTKAFTFQSSKKENFAEDWANEVVKFCEPVLIGKAKEELYKMKDLFEKYSELSLTFQGRIAGNIPRIYEALSTLAEDKQIEHIQMLALSTLLLSDALNPPNDIHALGETLLWIAGILTLVTGYNYLRAGLKHF